MKVIIVNKRARFDYEILETYEAGVELRGFEVKAIKNGQANINGARAIIRNEQVWLINADIPPYQPKNTPPDYDSKRTRRLLFKKEEIRRLIGKTREKGLTLIPLKVYIKGRFVKAEIGLVKIRKIIDKRELIKKREVQREILKMRK